MATKPKKKEPLLEEAEAKKAPKKSAAETMSKGTVKPTPAPDPVARGVKAMDDFQSGVKSDGSYMSGEERKGAFRSSRETRFNMTPEAAAAPKVTTRSLAVPAPPPVTSRGVIPHPYYYQTPPAPATPIDDGPPLPKSPSGSSKPAPKPSFGSRYGGTLGALGVMGADAVIPRADDSTASGYDINTARDTAVGAASWALPFMRNPRVAVPVALATGGYNLYRRLTDYHQANPTAQQDYEYQLPKADPNFWSQAPALLSDAGHLGSQSIRGFGNLVDRALNTYTPYPYMVKASQAAADYFTPPGLKGPQPAPQPNANLVNRALETATAGLTQPINVVTWQNRIGVGGPRSLSDQMKAAGYLRPDFPALTQAQRLGEQPLPPEYEAAKQKYLGDLKNTAQSGQPVEGMNFVDGDAAEKARLTQSVGQQDRINQILQERDRKMAEDFSRRQEEFKAATSPEANRNFFEGVKLRRQAQDLSRNRSLDPFENARRAQAFADNAARQAELTPDPNDSAMDFIPERDFRNRGNPAVEAARAIAQARQQGGEDPSQLDVVGQVLANTPGMDPVKTAAFLSQLENQRLSAENIRLDNERLEGVQEQNVLNSQFRTLSEREKFLQERLADIFIQEPEKEAFTNELATIQQSKNQLIEQNPDLFGVFAPQSAPSGLAPMSPAEADAALAQAKMLIKKNPARKEEVNKRLAARGLPPIP